MQGTQEALVKANELLSYYSQFLPEDYFNYDSEEEHDEGWNFKDTDLEQFASKSINAITG